VDPSSGEQQHWWLQSGGNPRWLAQLLGSPLRRSGQPAATAAELAEVFSPLPELTSIEAGPACSTAQFRYLLCAHRHGVRLSCWRHYPDPCGWQRRCGPMALTAFIRQFAAPPGASS
jgi:hypothetical protein